MSSVYRFDQFEVRPAERRLLAAGVPAALGNRAFDVLVCLIEHRDRLVTKQELLEAAWPGLVVEENNLSVQVSALRKILGAGAVATVAHVAQERDPRFYLARIVEAGALARLGRVSEAQTPLRRARQLRRHLTLDEIRRTHGQRVSVVLASIWAAAEK